MGKEGTGAAITGPGNCNGLSAWGEPRGEASDVFLDNGTEQSCIVMLARQGKAAEAKGLWGLWIC